MAVSYTHLDVYKRQAWARGEFVNYVDSDDFIHPQTFELAVALAERDRSDIVSWVPDMIYKRRLLLRAKLGQPYDDVVPWSMSQRYDCLLYTSRCV